MFRSPLATVREVFSTVRNPLTLVTSATSTSVSAFSASALDENFCCLCGRTHRRNHGQRTRRPNLMPPPLHPSVLAHSMPSNVRFIAWR